jgi:four helix bundle protein
MKNYEELQIWQEGCRLAVDIYQLTTKEPFTKDFGLRDQIRRSAVSIPSNIAEGKERETVKELVRYLYIAKGSVAELKNQPYIANRIGFIDVYQHDILSDRIVSLSKQIGSFIGKLKRGRIKESTDQND